MSGELRMRSMILGGLLDRCQRHAAATFLVVFTALLAVSTAAQAQTVLVGNLGQPRVGSANRNDIAAQSFTTGSHAGGYTISTVKIRLGDLNAATGIAVRIRRDISIPILNVFEQPGPLVAALTNPVTLTEDRVNTFTAPPGTTLDANTKYWITMNEGKNAAYRLGYEITTSDAENREPGWRIGNIHLARDNSQGATWSSQRTSLMIHIQGTPTAGLCKRTPEVSDALVDLIPGITHCADVTDAHLAAITGTLDLVSEEITALKARDFAGLNSLEILQLGNNMLTDLPAGVFDELTALKSLLLHENRLSELPDGVFDELTALSSVAARQPAERAARRGVRRADRAGDSVAGAQPQGALRAHRGGPAR